MAKIPRIAGLKQFGVNGSASDFGQWGSLYAGSPLTTMVPSVIQALSEFQVGLAQEVLAGARPALEDFNGIFLLIFNQLCYLLQQGIPEYDSSTTYFLNSFCSYSGLIYQCINDGSGAGITNVVPTNTGAWSPLVTGFGAWVGSSFGTTYQAANDGYVVAWGLQFGSSQNINGYTDSNSSPSTLRQTAGGSSGVSVNDSIMMPVRKGDYWQVSENGPSSAAVYWISN